MIDAAGRVGRQQVRDQLLLTMMFRHGLRVSEAVDLRWTDSRDRVIYTQAGSRLQKKAPTPG